MLERARYRPAVIVLSAIVALSGSLQIFGALNDAPTFDESAHIPAGYSYVRYFDYRLNHEHPPFVKVLSGLGMLALRPSFPVQSDAWTKDINGQWRAGSEFLYDSGNNAEELVFFARLGPVFLTLLTVLLLYIVSGYFVGINWALLPTFLFAFTPTILSHGHYVTTDIGSAFGVLIAFLFFFKYRETPTTKRLLLAGAAFGLAQLTKFSNILLGPIFVALIAIEWLAWLYINYRKLPTGEKMRRALIALYCDCRGLLFLFLTGGILVYIFYLVFAWNYPVEFLERDMQSVLNSFNPPLIKDVVIWLADIPFLKPLVVYLFGVLSVLQRAAGGNAAYFLGELSGQGWWYYFPAIYALKEPIPILLLLGAGFLAAIFRLRIRINSLAEYITLSFSNFAIGTFVFLYWLNSILSPLNIGVRHIIPTLPFIYILAAISLKKWFGSGTLLPFLGQPQGTINLFNRKLSLKAGLLAICLIWLSGEVASVTPNYLSYFNEFRGGTANGYRIATDSNYDWGQDLYRLRSFVEKNNIEKIAVDYFGGGRPEYSLPGKAVHWWSSRGNPQTENIEWLAVSANTLSGALGKPLPGFSRKSEDEYRWLQNIRDPWMPDGRAGYSIFIYRL